MEELVKQRQEEAELDEKCALIDKKLAASSMYDSRPYSTALIARQERFGQPRLLVQSEIGAILNSQIIHIGDVEAYDNFSLFVYSLVGMLLSLVVQR